ncbi:O-antigen ligase family protein [Thermoactinospora rubra]|uniref:O-antigen ligase family protein n=1 Tax=Thermoactinospora rubra TaxID=1088767 RepID=UPI000A1172DA|nr:O-antigen ligase family protein [Thermoactinospora rubra]
MSLLRGSRPILADPIQSPSVTLVRTPARVLLTVYLVMLLLVPSRFIIGPLGSAGTLAGVLGVGLLCWYWIAWLSPRSQVVQERQPLRMMLGFVLFAVLAGYAAAMTRHMLGAERNAADVALINIASWLGIALMAADSLSSLHDLEAIRRRMVNCGVVVAAVGILQFFTGFDIVQYLNLPGLTLNGAYASVGARDGFNRPTSTALHAIEFGVVMATLLPLALHGARHAPKGRAAWRWAGVFVIASGMMMSVSRSAVLGGVITLLMLLPSWSKKERQITYAVLVVFLGLMHVVAGGLIGTLKNLVLSIGTDSSTVARTDDYGDALGFFVQSPWFGRGLGTFLPQLYRVFDNHYLVFLVEVGLVGTVAFVGLFFTGFALTARARRHTADPARRHLARAFGAAMLVLIFSYGTFDALAFSMVAGLTFLVLGCCAAVWRLLRQEARDGLDDPVDVGVRHARVDGQ